MHVHHTLTILREWDACMCTQIQSRIDTVPKALYTATEDSAPGSNCHHRDQLCGPGSGWLQAEGQDLSHTPSCVLALHNMECVAHTWHMPALAPSLLLRPWMQSCIKGQPPKQGILLSQRGGPSSGSRDSLLTFLGRGDPSNPLGTGGNLSWILH